MKARLFAIAAALFVLALVPAAAAPFRLIVTDLETPLVPNSVMDLAMQQGYFAREGVEVELVRVQQTPSALAALQAGEGEMANISVDALLLLVAGGAKDLRAVVSPNKALPFLIAARDELVRPADLAGMRFGVGRPGSLDHSLSSRVLAASGVDVAAMEFLALGQPNARAQALLAGQIDATTISVGVWQSIPDRTGLHILIDQDAYFAAAPLVSKVNIVTEKVLAARGDEVRRVVTALIKASRDYAADPALWVSAMREALPDVEPAVLDDLAQRFAKSWSVNGGLGRDQLDATVTALYEGPDFAAVRPVALGEWVDFSILDAVLAQVGIDHSMDPATR